MEKIRADIAQWQDTRVGMNNVLWGHFKLHKKKFGVKAPAITATAFRKCFPENVMCSNNSKLTWDFLLSPTNGLSGHVFILKKQQHMIVFERESMKVHDPGKPGLMDAEVAR